MKFKSLIILILVLIIPIIIFFISFKISSNSSFETIKINKTRISVEVASTLVDQAKGLSGRKYLSKNHGMIFIFEEPSYYSFWMKDTLIPLDFIWIRDYKIVDITQNVQPKDYQPPKILTPKEKVDSVIEMNAGFIKNSDIKIGDKVTF